MSESMEFDDLELLERGDLDAVLKALEPAEVVAAFWGVSSGMRCRLLGKLPRRSAAKIQQDMSATEHVSFEQVRGAQQKVIAIMCRLSRGGQIAFDVPEDLVA
jgi:flagellar motor switch protein FliG